MYYFAKLFFLSIFILSTLFVADLVYAQVADNSLPVCSYQLLCERQAVVFEKIDSTMARVAQISNQELALEMIVSLEGARVLAQDGYLGKSLMAINAVDRVVRRELVVVEQLGIIEPFIISTSTLVSATTTIDTTSTATIDTVIITPTTTVEVLPVVEEVVYIDKGEIILFE
jgi:hypothetical protein